MRSYERPDVLVADFAWVRLTGIRKSGEFAPQGEDERPFRVVSLSGIGTAVVDVRLGGWSSDGHSTTCGPCFWRGSR